MSQIYTERRRMAEKPADAPQEQAVQESKAPMSAATPQSVMGQRTNLPDAVRQKMENAFGADFSSVELYESEAVADAGAKAVTMGNRIAFAPDAANLSSAAGQELLGHELSHVVSQARGEVQGRGFLNDRALETRADREGAMAAAGESIYTGPVTPLSASSVASAAGPMQAKKKDEKKEKDLSATKTPGTLDVKDWKSFKEGLNKNQFSVAGMGTTDGGEAVLKLGSNPVLEGVYSDIFNAAGDVYSKTRSNGWTFDTPAARALNEEERNSNVGNLIRGGVFHSRNDEAGRTTEDELREATVFGLAHGNTADHLSKEMEKSGKKTALQTITGEEKADYQRMMGYVTVMDMLVGNTDRVINDARGNWMDDIERQQVHLIDNDDQGNPSLRNGDSQRDAWVAALYSKLTNDYQEPASLDGLTHYIGNATLMGDTYSEKSTNAGIKQGFEDLPLIQEEMMNRFQETNGGSPFNTYQTEALERIRMTQEMLKPEMQQYYKKIANTNTKEETKKYMWKNINHDRLHGSNWKRNGVAPTGKRGKLRIGRN